MFTEEIRVKGTLEGKVNIYMLTVGKLQKFKYEGLLDPLYFKMLIERSPNHLFF